MFSVIKVVKFANYQVSVLSYRRIFAETKNMQYGYEKFGNDIDTPCTSARKYDARPVVQTAELC